MLDLTTIDDLPTLEAWLAEALIAEHKLLMGQSVVSVSYAAEGQNQRQFNQVSLTLEPLRMHIMLLREKISVLKFGRPRRRLGYL